MKLFLILLLYSSFSLAQYEQVVKPNRADEIISFTLYQFRNAMIEFLKTSRSANLLTPSRLSLLRSHYCQSGEMAGAELLTERNSSQDSEGVWQIKESLFLNTCQKNIELFAVERHGRLIQPTSDAQLLRGFIPDAKGTQFYRLHLIAKQVALEMVHEANHLQLDFEVTYSNGWGARARISESFADELLIEQMTQFNYLKADQAYAKNEIQYVWSIDRKNSVPRQYLYWQGQEVSPDIFLKQKNLIFNTYLLPDLQQMLQFQNFKF